MPASLGFPAYASVSHDDSAFLALHDAYSFRWTGTGFVNPGLDQDDVVKAGCTLGHIYIASCYEHVPAFNIIVVPSARMPVALKASLEHACVIPLVRLLARSCAFTMPSTLSMLGTRRIAPACTPYHCSRKCLWSDDALPT